MRTRSRSHIIIAIVSLLIFLTGTVHVALNMWDSNLPIASATNFKAICVGAFLTVSEIVFLYADILCASVKQIGKRIGAAVVMATLAVTMGWSISAEWEKSAKEQAMHAGTAGIAKVTEAAASQAKSKREREQVAQKGLDSAKAVVTTAMSTELRAFQVNFIAALLGLIVLQFCKPPLRGRLRREGNLSTKKPELANKAKQVGFVKPGEDAKVYAVNGGYSVYSNGRYRGFMKDDGAAGGSGKTVS